MQKDSWTTSGLKSVTWRLIASTTTAIIALVVTGNLETAGIVGFFDLIIKLGLYTLHERAWLRATKAQCEGGDTD